jgi:DNA polymerase-3 subunit chi
VRKIFRAGQKVVVWSDDAVGIANLDRALWTFSPLDFIPHCGVDSTHAASTPIVLTADLDKAPHHRVLLNLGAAVPAQFARFERLLEVVGNDPDELAAGRDRYRFYRDRGYALNNYKQGS